MVCLLLRARGNFRAAPGLPPHGSSRLSPPGKPRPYPLHLPRPLGVWAWDGSQRRGHCVLRLGRGLVRRVRLLQADARRVDLLVGRYVCVWQLCRQQQRYP